jgi:mRNA interferase MazF
VPYSPFDVVLLSFPFSEKKGAKRRPGLVVSAEGFNRAHSHAVIAMITTASHTRWPTDHPIAHHREAGLEAPCVVRAKLVTIADEMVIGRVGRLTDDDADSTRRWVRDLMC